MSRSEPLPPGAGHPPRASPVAAGRRRVLVAGAAAWGLAMAAGCAVVPRTGPSIGRVVIVGGGYGGATAARYLRRWGGNVDVTLVEREASFVSCPMSNLVVAKLRGIDTITVGYHGLRAAGVRVVRGEVVAVDADARRVRLADGSALPYDRLVVSPGVDFVTDGVGGLAAAINSGRVVHAWKAGAQTLALRRQLEAMPTGGVYALFIPKAPFRCPPGPYERACLVATYLRRHKPGSKVLVLDANSEIQSKKTLFERAFADRHAGVVEYRPNAELREIADGVARLDFEDVRADVLNVVPAQRAGDIARAAGLVNVNGRWAGVDWLTMASTAVPFVHVLGDSTFPAEAMPKSGHMANQQAKLAAAAIVRLLKGEPVDPDPLVMNTCYSFVDATDAVHVASVHRYDTAGRTFKPVAGAGGVSAAASALEGRYAVAWADNIRHDMLG